jgi:2-polyprenyl-3-methyl-5-hydroxy-6-metoxy-1,4-benzoquinol methylase
MSKASEYAYGGGELALFAHAKNWKQYWGAQIRSYLQGEILEVGSGIGANLRLLRNERQRRWVCLEPDAQLLLKAKGAENRLLNGCEFVEGTLAVLNNHEQFDAILYIDVLEHIDDDRGELEKAAVHLKPGGRLIVLSPAHPWLFSKFDAAIGHHRRYTRKSLLAITASSLKIERVRYLDSCGLIASLANRLLLRQPLPTINQILFWDRVLIPMSRVLDPLLGFTVGKSILAVWKKQERD